MQLTGRPWVVSARAVLGPMAANCRGRERELQRTCRAGWAEGQGLGPVRSSRLMRELMAHVVTPPDVNPALHPQNAFVCMTSLQPPCQPEARLQGRGARTPAPVPPSWLPLHEP